MKNDSVLSARANDLSDKLCVCRHIVSSKYWLKYCAAAIKKTWTLTETKSLFWPVLLRLFSKTWSHSGMIGENRCKAARRGHTLRSGKINKVKSKETGGWKPPDTNLFLIVYAHFFLQFYPVFILCFFTFSSLCPYLMSPVDRRKCVCLCVCLYECCRSWHAAWLCFRCTRGKFYAVLFSVDTSVLFRTTLKMERFAVFCVCVYFWV